jgi:hypothetical protein
MTATKGQHLVKSRWGGIQLTSIEIGLCMHTAVLQNNHLPTSTLRATQITFVNSEASGLGLRRGFSRQLVGCDCDLQGSKAVFLEN